MDGKHGRMMSGMTCHHRFWTAHMLKRRQAWHVIIDFGQHTQSNDVGPCMPSSPFGSRNGRTTSSMACSHHLCAAQTVERRRAWHAIIPFGLADEVRQRRAWHAIITLGLQTRSNDVRREMPSAPLQHRQPNGVGRGMPSSPLGSTDGRTASGVACHHRP